MTKGAKGVHTMRKMEEKHDGSKIRARGTLTTTRRRWLIRFSEDEGKCGRWARKVEANAARVHVEDIRGIVLSTLPTQHPSFSLFSFPSGNRRREGDEANQGIMEELHTCAASPMLYYINRARIQSDLPFKFI